MLLRPGAQEIIIERGAAGIAAIRRGPVKLLHHLRDRLELLFHDQAAHVLMREAGALAQRLFRPFSGIIIAQSDGEKAFNQRSEEPTSELKSLMRISYAVFFLNNKKTVLMRTKHNIHK